MTIMSAESIDWEEIEAQEKKEREQVKQPTVLDVPLSRRTIVNLNRQDRRIE